MGRQIASVVLSALFTFTLTAPAFAQIDDGFKPLQPTMGDETWSSENSEDLPAPGSQSPRKPRVRPDNSPRGFKVEAAKTHIADVGEEFECPLFENKAYQGVMDALNKLNDALKTSVQCPEAPSMSAVSESAKQIREAVEGLQPIMDQPEFAHGQMKALEDNISKAVIGVDGIVRSLTNPAFVESACGENFHQGGGVVTALSNLVTNLGPFALLGISLAPGLSAVVKGSALAIIAGASTVSEYQKLTFGRQLNMANHEHWKAVVQNTCSYSRVARKLNYIERYTSGLIRYVDPEPVTSVLPDEIRIKVKEFEDRYMNRQDDLGKKIQTALADKKNFNKISFVIGKANYELNRILSQIGDAKLNPEIACSAGIEISKQAMANNSTFPEDLVSLSEKLDSYDKDVHIAPLLTAYTMTIKFLQAKSATAFHSEEEINSCAQRSMTLIETIRRIATAYSKALKEIQNTQEAHRLKDASYRQWKAESVALEKQQTLGRQLYNVMSKLENETAILRSYLNQRHNSLKTMLLSDPGFSSRSPVALWLNHTMSLHEKSIKNFKNNLEILADSSFYLTGRKMGIFQRKSESDRYKVNNESGKVDSKVAIAKKSSRELLGLTLENFNLKNTAQVREHQLVCQRLLNTWDSWVEASNHLDAAGLFCNMVDPMIDLKTDSAIISFCRGSDRDVVGLGSTKQSKISSAILNLLKEDNAYNKKSAEDMALKIPNIMKNLKCTVGQAQ